MTSSATLFDAQTLSGWHLESDPTSTTALVVASSPGGSELQFRYRLSGGPATGQNAALVWLTPSGNLHSGISYTRLTFTARAERPMRVSVQLRGPGVDGQLGRWTRSVYLDTFDRELTVSLDDLTPSADTNLWKPRLDQVNAVMFVVDTVNTNPGSAGRIWIKKAVLER